MATITNLQSTDNGADSLSIINTNLENLNTDKLESSDLSGYELLSNKETSALDTSTTKYPCNNVVKSAVDGKIANVVEDTTPQLGGNLDAQDKNITGAGSIGFTQELDNGSKTASFSIDFSTDQKQKVTLTANTMTLTLDTTNLGVGNYLLKIVNGGLATLTVAAETGSVLWSGGAVPTFTSSGTDLLAVFFDGTDFYLQASLGFATV